MNRFWTDFKCGAYYGGIVGLGTLITGLADFWFYENVVSWSYFAFKACNMAFGIFVWEVSRKWEDEIE